MTGLLLKFLEVLPLLHAPLIMADSKGLNYLYCKQKVLHKSALYLL